MAGRCEDCGVEAENVHLVERGPNSGSSFCPKCLKEADAIFWLMYEAVKRPFYCKKCRQLHEPFQFDCDKTEFLRRKRCMEEYDAEKRKTDAEDNA